MARAPLSQQSDYELVNKDQDLRGWQVLDENGATLGGVADLIVDTEAERVELLLLSTGREISIHDVTLGDHLVLLAPRRQHAQATEALPGEAIAAGLKEELRLPVIEQELRIGKRDVLRGGVRVNTRVQERPVSEQITLREEHVVVERRPMDLPVSDAFIDKLPRAAVEVVAQAEEAVVAKQARVVEEVVVRRDVEERVETVRDTLRRTDVDVESMAAQAPRRRD
ncbi:MAG: PRC and DUF2382 domain-containing protein [Polyangia bacterium]